VRRLRLLFIPRKYNEAILNSLSVTADKSKALTSMVDVRAFLFNRIRISTLSMKD
jgi:hypothetical protein